MMRHRMCMAVLVACGLGWLPIAGSAQQRSAAGTGAPTSVSARAAAGASSRFFLMLRSDGDVRTFAGRTEVLAPTVRALLARWGADVTSVLPAEASLRRSGGDALARLVLVRVPRAGDVAAAMREAGADAAVEYVQREGVLAVDGWRSADAWRGAAPAPAPAPNDSAWSGQWGAQRVGTLAAWDRSRGAGVVVGVIDTGIDHVHPDLRTQLWINAAEDANGNGRYDAWPASELRDGVAGDFDGVDNDGNGFVDDVTGYDFVDQAGFDNAAGGDYRDPDADVTDEMGHGTNVSGIIAAAANNGIGIAGVAPEARIMTLRAFDARGLGAEGDVARALAYAVVNGARVVNMSFGDVVYSRVLRDMVRWAHARGVVMPASAGNSQTDVLHYPSAYGETISVSATTASDGLAGFSNYGATVDVAAPGVDVTTTEPGGTCTGFNGTSASAPFVSAAAALLVALHPDATPDEVRGMIIASAIDKGAAGWDARYGAGLLDAGRALALDAPSVVRILTPRTDDGISSDAVAITGTAASPIMTGFVVQYGVGRNPIRWTDIAPVQSRQAVGELLAVWNVAALPDTTYTIRLSAQSTKGITLEDRVVVRIDRRAPRVVGVGFVPAINGRAHGVAAGFITDEPTLGRVWYRRAASGDDWRWVSAEGGTVNNLFVSTTHSIWLGEEHLVPGASYEFYFTATDEAGFTTKVGAPSGGNFTYTIPLPVASTGFVRKPHGYANARIADRTLDVTGDGRPELVLNTFEGDQRLQVLAFDGAQFTDIAGGVLGLQYLRGVGDVTGDGRAELLTSYVRTGSLWGSDAPGTLPSRLLWADTTSGFFWPAGMVDVDRDGTDEVLAIVSDSTVGVYKSSPAGRLTRWGTITNPTRGAAFMTSTGATVYDRNSFSAPRVAAGDFNGNGKTDLLFGDADGDFFIAEYRLNGEFQIIWQSENDYQDGSDFVAAGDFDGDGRDEFAIGVRTLADDVIPFWYVGIYALGAQNATIERWSARFAGVEEAAQSGVFRRISNSMTAANIDDTPAKELIVTTYPELYVVSWSQAARAFDVSFMLPLVNTNAVAVGDFDGNGIPEMAFATADSVEVWEKDLPATAPAAPRAVTATYLSPRQVRLAWTGAPGTTRYRIYKGASAATLAFFGESSVAQLTDFDITPGTTVVYAVAAFDTTKSPPESVRMPSRVLHPHAQPVVDSVASLGSGQLRVRVSEDLATELPPTSCFLLDESVEPVSVALLDRRTMLVTFPPIAPGLHGLRVRALRDGEGIPFLDETYPVTVDAEVVPRCYIERVTFAPPRGFVITFSGPVDPISAVVPGAYTVSPLGAATTVRLDEADQRIVHVTLGGAGAVGAIGQEYVLRVDGVRCADGTLITGAGSTAGVVLNRENLDDMFVFPNPWAPAAGADLLTFANLTPRAVIRIYTLSGQFVREVSERDGNGGTEWDLRDDAGQLVPAGVYIYYATGTDAQGREVTPKTGKLAIAR